MDASCFFQVLFCGYSPGFQLKLICLPKDKESKPIRAFYPLWEGQRPHFCSLEMAYKTALLWQRYGDVYMGVLPREGRSGYGQAATAARVLWSEIDGHEEGQDGAIDLLLRAIDRGLDPPHLTVASGNGLHLYWLLGETYVTKGKDKYRFIELLQRLAHTLGGLRWEDSHLHAVSPARPYADPTCCDVARILRVPGTWNHKPTRNCEVKLLSALCHDSPVRTFAEWDTRLPEKPKPEEREGNSVGVVRGTLPPWTQEALARTYPKGERYYALREILLYARRSGYELGELLGLVDEFCQRHPGTSRREKIQMAHDTYSRVQVQSFML